MTKTTCLSFAVLACGLMAGTTLAFALLGSPADFSYPTFVEYFQAMVRSVRVPLVALGVSGLALLAASTFLTWRERPRLYFVGAALLLDALATLVTVLGNVPINEQIMGWDPREPAAGWQALIEDWWQWHLTRFWATGVAFVLLVAAMAIPAKRH